MFFNQNVEEPFIELLSGYSKYQYILKEQYPSCLLYTVLYVLLYTLLYTLMNTVLYTVLKSITYTVLYNVLYIYIQVAHGAAIFSEEHYPPCLMYIVLNTILYSVLYTALCNLHSRIMGQV